MIAAAYFNLKLRIIPFEIIKKKNFYKAKTTSNHTCQAYHHHNNDHNFSGVVYFKLLPMYSTGSIQ